MQYIKALLTRLGAELLTEDGKEFSMSFYIRHPELATKEVKI